MMSAHFQVAENTAALLKKSFPQLIIEVSGGITLNTMDSYFTADIDVLSMSCLTQGYDCIDFSMKIVKEGRDPVNPVVKSGITSKTQ